MIPDGPAAFRRLIVALGIAMVAAGDAVDVIEEALRRIVAAYGVPGLQIALLPADDAARIGPSTVRNADTAVREAQFLLFGPEKHQVFVAALAALPGD